MDSHHIKEIPTSDMPRVFSSMLFIEANDENPRGIIVPVNEIKGSYEELRGAMHRDVDAFFDSIEKVEKHKDGY